MKLSHWIEVSKGLYSLSRWASMDIIQQWQRYCMGQSSNSQKVAYISSSQVIFDPYDFWSYLVHVMACCPCICWRWLAIKWWEFTLPINVWALLGVMWICKEASWRKKTLNTVTKEFHKKWIYDILYDKFQLNRHIIWEDMGQTINCDTATNTKSKVTIPEISQKSKFAMSPKQGTRIINKVDLAKIQVRNSL